MDNIQLYHIDNEINKIDEMKEGGVIYKNGMELLVVLSYDHNEPCRGCFFYKDNKCGSERLIKCWDCKKEYKFINDNVDEENKIIYDTIMMIGDASGKEGQFSDSDKKTAENFGCEYMDVDDFVYKYNNR